MGSRRGQAAMEFLMTYGWAILVIIIVIAVLFYIGVMNPKNMQNDTCMLAPGFSCYTFKIATETGALELDLGQATGSGIVVTAVGCSEDPSAQPQALANSVYIPSGEHRYVTGGNSGNYDIECEWEGGNEFGERYKGALQIEYQTSDGIFHLVSGDISATLSPGSDSWGGAGCSPNCTNGENCTGDTDCISGYCDPVTDTCQDAPDCSPNCGIGEGCDEDGDCTSGYCDLATNTCQASSEPPACAPDWIVQSCPCELNVPGIYTIRAEGLSSSATCITIPAAGSGSTLDCGGRAITGSGTNFTSSGIYLNSAGDVTVKNCVVTAQSYGIRLGGSNNNNLISNVAQLNINRNILLESSVGNNVTGNTLSGSTYGIFLQSGSTGNRVGSNILSAGSQAGIYLAASGSNDIVSNTINSGPWNGIDIASSDNVNLVGNTVTSNDMHGVALQLSNNIVFSGNTLCSNNQSGGAYYDLSCDGSSTGSGSSVFGTRSGCSAVTRTSGCPNGAGCNEDAGCASWYCDLGTNTCQPLTTGWYSVFRVVHMCDNSPVEGATLQSVTGPTIKSTLTNAMGGANLTGLEPGEYSITLSKPPFLSGGTKSGVDIYAGNGVDDGIWGLVPSVGWISGYVLDSTGDAIDNALVNVTNAPGSPTNTTDGSGYYIIHDLAWQGNYNVNASKSGYVSSIKPVSILTRCENPLNFTLAAE